MKKLGLAGGGATLRLGYQQQGSASLAAEKAEKLASRLGDTGSLEETFTSQCEPRQELVRKKLSEDQKEQPSTTTPSGSMMETTLHMEQGNVTSKHEEVTEANKEVMECNVEAMKIDEEAMETSEGAASLLTTQSDVPQFPVLPFSIFPKEVHLPLQDRLTEPADSQDLPSSFADARGRRVVVNL